MKLKNLYKNNKIIFSWSFFLVVAFFLATLVIKATPRLAALNSDARNYYDLALSISEKSKILSHLTQPDYSRFIDGGYVTFLTIIYNFFGIISG